MKPDWWCSKIHSMRRPTMAQVNAARVNWIIWLIRLVLYGTKLTFQTHWTGALAMQGPWHTQLCYWSSYSGTQLNISAFDPSPCRFIPCCSCVTGLPLKMQVFYVNSERTCCCEYDCITSQEIRTQFPFLFSPVEVWCRWTFLIFPRVISIWHWVSHKIIP